MFYSYNLLAETDPSRAFIPDFLSEVDPECFISLAKSHFNRIAPAHVTDRLLYIDMKFTITDNDLRKVTQMVEAAGLKVRYPLLDRDLVDFTATVPPTLKVKFRRNRYIFKLAMEGFLPDEGLQGLAGDADPVRDTERLHKLKQLDLALSQLSEEHRIIVILHDTEGYKLEEIHELIGIPVGTVKSRLHRARARLKEILTEGGTFS